MAEPLALFGLGTTSLGVFSEEYRDFLKRRNKRRKNKQDLPRLLYVPQFRQALQTADIYLIETVKTLVAVRDQLSHKATVIVADSPLLLSELAGLQPLDWRKDAWKFKIQAVDLGVFEAARLAATKNPPEGLWAGVIPVALDRLGLVIDETTSGLLLAPINSVVNQLGFLDRVAFRQSLARYLATQTDLAAFEVAVKRLISEGASDSKTTLKSFAELAALLKQHGPTFQQAIACMAVKKSPNKHLKDTAITPFEIRYLSRLCSTNKDKVNVA